MLRLLSYKDKTIRKIHVHVPVPNRLQAMEASRKSLCHEQFVVRGKSRSTEEQIADPCRRRVA